MTKTWPEKFVFGLLAVSFFVGLWHAFPMLKVVSDEMYFVGGVLRAMENFTVIPLLGDVPYGIVTYFLNYGLIGAYLAILLPFFGFSLGQLKSALVQSPELVYFVPRFLSALLALVYLHIFNQVMIKEILATKVRLYLLILLFTNMLTVLVLHTGKMWVLSVLLVVFSFYFFYQALRFNQLDRENLVSKNILLSIIFAFLAAANFIFNVVFLINIPLLLIFFGKNRLYRQRIFIYTVVGLLIFAALLLLNFENTKQLLVNQFTYYRPVLDQAVADVANTVSVPESLVLYLFRIILFFPLIIATLLAVLNRQIRNKQLFALSLVYFLVYLGAISFMATWSTGIYTFIHYAFPFGFFLIFLLASFDIKFNKLFYVFALISVVYGGLTLYYLSVPTTYNQAYNWTVKNLSSDNTLVFNDVREIDLPKNKASYLLTEEESCASQCQNVIAQDLNKDFKPLVIDKYTKVSDRLGVFPEYKGAYYISLDPVAEASLELVAAFTNPVEAGFALEGRMANYFDLDFFRIKNFGPNIYIFKSTVL